ncbi:GumC family protein [Pareuzebyella sediminis]|uniref:GumC family protein n=1 Tax=Pareuzebyella sediminis TaxID=2607998 RepID=UPI0011EBF8C7|nr:polysaccharide biosynthesis tyrosine autokinase [Pareuzebyella sediminis]
MNEKKVKHINAHQEINLKMVLRKVYNYKILFVSCIVISLLIALAYIFLATKQYEAATSVLIDSSGRNRALGESKYVEGGVGLIEMEKNLYNEIAIIKSFSVIGKTVKDLDFDVSYYTKGLLKEKEHYGYFPFEVVLDKSKSQLYGIPIKVKILSENRYELYISGSDFVVSNSSNNSRFEVSRDFEFSKAYDFGEEVTHDYFNFVIKKPDYNVNAEDFKDDLLFVVQDLDAVTNNYTGKLEVANIDLQASIIKITSSGPVVKKEIDFLQKLTQNYIEDKMAARNQIASGKETFIRNQLKVVSDSLANVELKLESFKRNKRAVNLGATAMNALGQTQNLQTEKAKIELDIKYYNSLIQEIKSNQNSDEFIVPTAVGIEDQSINDNIKELKRLYAERSKKKFFVTSNNEEMSILNKQIDESTELLLNNLRSAIKSSEFSLSRVSSQLSNYNGVISNLPTNENQLLSIERQSTLYENLFNYLSQELAKAGIARSESTTDTRVLDEARMVGNGPVSPKRNLILGVALVFGMMLPLAWVVLFSTNDTIENIDQITQNTDIPVIASIVHHDSKSKIPKSDISLWKLKESFRDLVTNMKLVNAVDRGVIGITSIMPEEGKTFSAINLGITFAEAGKKTLIIDTDLRNPSLVKGIRKVEGKGLSNYLESDAVSLNDIIYPHEKLENLKFIPTSVTDGNVHELLSGAKMKSIVLNLKEDFDYIIIDTPAVGLVSDFLILWDLIDINLFVVRRKIAKIKFLEDFEKLIPRGKRKKSFIVFNGALKKYHKYGYRAKYGENKEIQLVNESLSV